MCLPLSKLSNYLIRPKRMKYSNEDLGPNLIQIDDTIVERKDFEVFYLHISYTFLYILQVFNDRNQKLHCSLFKPDAEPKEGDPQPCVVFCHGNAGLPSDHSLYICFLGSRLSAWSIIYHVLVQYIPVVCFDFSGCGHSEGDYITLGFHERHDLQAVINHIIKEYHFDKIGMNYLSSL